VTHGRTVVKIGEARLAGNICVFHWQLEGALGPVHGGSLEKEGISPGVGGSGRSAAFVPVPAFKTTWTPNQGKGAMCLFALASRPCGGRVGAKKASRQRRGTVCQFTARTRPRSPAALLFLQHRSEAEGLLIGNESTDRLVAWAMHPDDVGGRPAGWYAIRKRRDSARGQTRRRGATRQLSRKVARPNDDDPCCDVRMAPRPRPPPTTAANSSRSRE